MNRVLLIILVIIFFLPRSSFAENIILTCNWNNDPNSKFNFHIDSKKNQLIQFDDTIQDPPALAITTKSSIFLAIGRDLDLSQSNEINKRYSDNIRYQFVMFYWSINRYTGKFTNHSQSFTYDSFEKKKKPFIIKQRNSGYKNAYYKFLKFGQKNDGPGSRLNDTFGDGICIKSEKKF